MTSKYTKTFVGASGDGTVLRYTVLATVGVDPVRWVIGKRKGLVWVLEPNCRLSLGKGFESLEYATDFVCEFESLAGWRDAIAAVGKVKPTKVARGAYQHDGLNPCNAAGWQVWRSHEHVQEFYKKLELVAGRE